ncbi:MAG: hypothetical protein SGI98_07925 [Verrucomicrobiota bacterium]|nr:hypothetical protein [Verrucomicrobiota bacterium]
MATEEGMCGVISGQEDPRASWEMLYDQISSFNRKTQLTEALERDPRGMIILNPFRQIIYCNQSFLELTHKNSTDDVYALRPGEVLGCVNALSATAGCGSNPECRLCNIDEVIREIQKGISFAGKENIHVASGQENEVMALKVSGAPLKIGEEIFLLLVVSAC